MIIPTCFFCGFVYYHIQNHPFYTVVLFFYVAVALYKRLLALILFLIFLIAVAFEVQFTHRGPVFLKALFDLA